MASPLIPVSQNLKPIVIRRNRLLSLLVVAWLVAAYSGPLPTLAQVESEISAWRPLAPGIDYRQFYLPTPNRLYVARLDRAHPGVTLESGLASGRLNGGLETVRQIAGRYDQSLSYWGETWGPRNQVIVAINGGFYEAETGSLLNGHVQSGWYVRQFNPRQNGSGFAWTLDGVAFVGGCVIHRPGRQQVKLLDTGEIFNFARINDPPEADEVVLYTPQVGPILPKVEGALNVLVEVSRPLLILPSPAMITGAVRLVSPGAEPMAILFDQLALSATGQAAAILAEKVQVGGVIGISQEITHFEPDCRTPSPYSWSKTYAAVGSSFNFLRQGQVSASDDPGALFLNPRTAVAFNARYIFFIVVDGRDRVRSAGMSMVDLALFARNRLGAEWGVALDGGGSSTLVVNGVVMNNPNAELASDNSLDRSVAGPKIERGVANGLMMVSILPKEQSFRFEPGQPVVITEATFVYSGPGTNYPVLVQLAAGVQGILGNESQDLNGVMAQGAYWWYVDFSEWSGWVSEAFLQARP